MQYNIHIRMRQIPAHWYIKAIHLYMYNHKLASALSAECSEGFHEEEKGSQSVDDFPNAFLINDSLVGFIFTLFSGPLIRWNYKIGKIETPQLQVPQAFYGFAAAA